MSDFHPLTPQIVRGLNDKIYDKRKTAALEVERIVRDYVALDDRECIKQILQALVQDFAYSLAPNSRNGGLIGLAAAAIALGSDVVGYLDDIVPPVLACFSDQEWKVRYQSCESMYNIAKVSKGEILRFFNEIFDALSKLATDTELAVKTAANTLDRLIKDVVSEQSTIGMQGSGAIEPGDLVPTRTSTFSLPRFIPLLSERIYTLNPFTRHFLVSWITVLDSIPDLELVSYLPEFLDGLIKFLSDTNPDVRVATSTLLGDFLREITEAAEVRFQQKQTMALIKHMEAQSLAEKSEIDGATLEPKDVDDKALVSPNDSTLHDWETLSVNHGEGKGKGVWVPGQGVTVDYARIVEILKPHLVSSEEEIQATALRWVNEFILLAKDIMIAFVPTLITAVLPCLAHQIDAIRLIAIQANTNLFKLILEIPAQPQTDADLQQKPSETPSGRLSSMSDRSLPASNKLKKEPVGKATDSPDSELAYEISSVIEVTEEDPFDYQATVNALTLQFLNEHEETRVASLEWLLMLHKKAPHKIHASEDVTFPALLKTLSDSSEEVVRRDLQLLAQISSTSDGEYFTRFMEKLLSLLSTDRRLLDTRGSLIIRQLCLSLDPERIYRTFAEILEKDEDLEFAGIMVQTLNTILITSPELAELRRRLKHLDSKENQVLFIALYKSWCHNAVATFSLCLLAQVYEHAASLLQIFADLEITVNFLIQIDKLVQLLESPVFTYLRLQLLEPEKYPYLFKCLYGVLMLLPQSGAFATLRNRLSSVNSLGFLHLVPQKSEAKPPESRRNSSKPAPTQAEVLKFSELLSHFRAVQFKHEKSRNQSVQSTSRSSSQSRRRNRVTTGTSRSLAAGLAGLNHDRNGTSGNLAPGKNSELPRSATSSPSFGPRIPKRLSKKP
ncbi:ARM repeat-containing protein [Basidiobolus meristosporus CBS 931.73]|uniref:ARM repeat-containing protein n=1 Tax=Basidiobolus meristosporus CBS 931.73 TaxID=1314790 RepID=A0A1Y1YST8_9FUNG|nr:ARM repeat-containing protein [Basidiobolus meristosporus CBS 931.73]|eukprot:ORY01103.1 ARM repeat-containing protein [Basidiobolus meristosporus CBS 931.73]